MQVRDTNVLGRAPRGAKEEFYLSKQWAYPHAGNLLFMCVGYALLCLCSSQDLQASSRRLCKGLLASGEEGGAACLRSLKTGFMGSLPALQVSTWGVTSAWALCQAALHGAFLQKECKMGFFFGGCFINHGRAWPQQAPVPCMLHVREKGLGRGRRVVDGGRGAGYFPHVRCFAAMWGFDIKCCSLCYYFSRILERGTTFILHLRMVREALLQVLLLQTLE